MTGAASRWQGSAFGLNLVGEFAAPGLDSGSRPAGAGPITALVRVSREDPNDAWPSTGVQLLYEHTLPSGTFEIRRHHQRGYRVDHSYFGNFQVAADGSRTSCAPADLPDWLWQRLLVGQLLPLASLLRGYEPLDASAVAIDGRAVIVMGPSGVDKSSVGLHMMAGGASFVTDDVAALELRDGTVVVHEGSCAGGNRRG